MFDMFPNVLLKISNTKEQNTEPCVRYVCNFISQFTKTILCSSNKIFINPFKHQLIKWSNTPTIRREIATNCSSVFDHGLSQALGFAIEPFLANGPIL